MTASPTPPDATRPTITVRALEVAETYELRRRVLRRNDPGARVHIYEDDSPEAFHLGAERDDVVIATASFYPIACPVRPGAETPYQLRFMAVAPNHQGSGAGHAVMRAAFDELRSRGGRTLWANARDTALRFYTELGFETIGDSFIEPATGLAHTVVFKPLQS